ncbi:sigma-54-dependent Fis family transcriptional regulator [Marinomonas agarivorans]|nr:sigma-54-dependent Fis family transcriptional regulator [Marinomonas agarivorans]
MNHALIIHSNCIYFNELQYSLTHSGFLVTASNSFSEAREMHKTMTFDVILIAADIVTNDLTEQLTYFLPCSIIILDEYHDETKKTWAKENGAHAYLPLPISTKKLLEKVIYLLEKKYQQSLSEQKKNKKSVSSLASIVGDSQGMKQLFQDIEKVAKTDVTVLIRGESGSGKELIAKAIHKLSARNKKPLISINCAAIPESLIESELFGHEKGAFTGATSSREGLIAAADKGTLFLDEIGELPLEAQARLLRFLQEGEVRKVGAVQASTVNVRILTATHRDLRDMVDKGLFREDLYYRLYVMELLLPPLRERGSDISLIAKHLVKKMGEKHQKRELIYTREFEEAILSHDWPGNVRELENAIERAIILSEDSQLNPQDLKLHTIFSGQKNLNTVGNMQGTTLDDYFIHYVKSNQHSMTETQIAQNLGISRKSLWEKRQKLNIKKKSNT